MKTDTERIEILEEQLSKIIEYYMAACANTERMLEERLRNVDGLDLVAAHNNLIERVDMHAKRETDTNNKRGDSLRRELEQFRKEMRQNFSNFEAEIQTRVENSIVVLFEEYGVVSSHDNRPIQAGVE